MSDQQPDDERPRPRLTRADLGSWLSGPGSVLPSEQRYRGERLGLPEEGTGSVAGWGRRLAALVVDWVSCLLLVRLFVPQVEYGTPASSFLTLGFFLAETTLFGWLVGASFGQRLLGLAIVRLEGGPPGLVRAFLRQLQVCLLLPPLVFDRDGRGLHDRSLHLVLVRR